MSERTLSNRRAAVAALLAGLVAGCDEKQSPCFGVKVGDRIAVTVVGIATPPGTPPVLEAHPHIVRITDEVQVFTTDIVQKMLHALRLVPTTRDANPTYPTDSRVHSVAWAALSYHNGDAR